MLSDVRSQVIISYKLFSYFEVPEPIIREIQGLLSTMTLHDLEVGVKVKLDTAIDLQTMISNKLFSHSKPVGPMIREILELFDMHPI